MEQPARRRHRPGSARAAAHSADDQRHAAPRLDGRPRRSERLQLELLGARRPAGSKLRRTARPPGIVRERGARRDRRRGPVAPDLGPAVRDAVHGRLPERPAGAGVLPPVPLSRGRARAPAEARRHARVCRRPNVVQRDAGGPDSRARAGRAGGRAAVGAARAAARVNRFHAARRDAAGRDTARRDTARRDTARRDTARRDEPRPRQPPRGPPDGAAVVAAAHPGGRLAGGPRQHAVARLAPTPEHQPG